MITCAASVLNLNLLARLRLLVAMHTQRDHGQCRHRCHNQQAGAIRILTSTCLRKLINRIRSKCRSRHHRSHWCCWCWCCRSRWLRRGWARGYRSCGLHRRTDGCRWLCCRCRSNCGRWYNCCSRSIASRIRWNERVGYRISFRRKFRPGAFRQVRQGVGQCIRTWPTGAERKGD